MNYNKKQSNNGFTIVEALIAIFILSVSVVSMLGLNITSTASARYTNNEITANYLMQEAIDSIRNTRDTMAFQHKVINSTISWTNFLNKYGYPNSSCFSNNGCIVKIENFSPDGSSNTDISSCGSNINNPYTIKCPFLNFDITGNKLFYNYDAGGVASRFKRQINMSVFSIDGNPDGVKVTVKIEWLNGEALKSRSLDTILLNWQKD